MSGPASKVFSFGKNWKDFLDSLDEEKIHQAEKSLQRMLKVDSLKNKRFLDAGCGSGLFSLAALRLGAQEVVSFDLDNDSVECAQILKKRLGPFPQWRIITGSALDQEFLHNLGKFDIVYSWGVLHHTGNMWVALANMTIPVAQNGLLFISIYNDQGGISKFWRHIKRLYNIVPVPIKWTMALIYYVIVLIVKSVQGITQGKPISQWYEYGNERGMNLWHDVVDWIGGYPFETATPKQIESFYNQRGYKLVRSQIKTGSGCSEFILQKVTTITNNQNI